MYETDPRKDKEFLSKISGVALPPINHKLVRRKFKFKEMRGIPFPLRFKGKYILWHSLAVGHYHSNPSVRELRRKSEIVQASLEYLRDLKTFKIPQFPSGAKHPFHIVDPSPWPFYTSVGLLFFTSGFAMYMHEYLLGALFCIVGLVITISSISFWFDDVIYEATFQGKHTRKVQLGLKYGMGLFILSEIMFFLSFFWAFFHSSLSPSVELGCIWPPSEILIINPYAIPLWNTLLLVTSGITITLSHANLRLGNLKESLNNLYDTIALGVVFTELQVLEYCTSEFTISDSVYGSVFYMITGFHGFHVIVGTIFLIVCAVRMSKKHFTMEHHVGYEFAIWYWHFVDVIWILVYVLVYIWGNYQI